MSTTAKSNYNIAFLLYQKADILDFSGPLEVFASTPKFNAIGDVSNVDFAFTTHLIASTPTIAANGRGCMTVSAESTIEEASRRIEDFDILVVPGAEIPIVQNFAQSDSQELQFIKAFNTLPPRQDGNERIILSVCTGALLLAAAGVLKGLKATTHHTALKVMKEVDQSINVVSSVGEGAVGRYVDGGRNEDGTRVVTAGGVTCGLDASLFVAELKAGFRAAEWTAQIMEHEWKRA